jgi:hypothetical protein
MHFFIFPFQLPKQNGRLSKQDGRLLHVMFWIHGGGFAMGSGVDTPPQYLMDKNVVYVSINYRLSALGMSYYEKQHFTRTFQYSLFKRWFSNNFAFVSQHTFLLCSPVVENVLPAVKYVNLGPKPVSFSSKHKLC